MTAALEASALASMLESTAGIERLLEREPPLVTITPSPVDPAALESAVGSLAALPLIVAGLAGTDAGHPSMALADLTIDPDLTALEHIEWRIRERPKASVALALLLRGAAGRSVAEGLVAESSVYSMLQAGPEFRAWLSTRSKRSPATGTRPPVRLDREGNVLRVTLCRPEKHNALNTAMRDALFEAFTVAAADPTTQVVLEGEGASFCAGGDLDEFGSFSDPASAHLIRLQRSVGRLMAPMSERITAVLHGSCLGAGMELPAFCGHVVARPDARLGLPEITLGLIPGAGGTVSVTRRIGRHRTALLALSGETVDAHTALRWGLVDEVSP
jgi:enoyl-CoA hydratase/isomerase-like protein